MVYRNLDEFLHRLELAGEVAHITLGESELGTSEVSAQDANKVQLFTDTSGTRIVRNLFGTRHRVEQALRVASLDLIAQRLEQLMEIGKPGALGVMISRAMTMFSAIRTTTNRRAPNDFQQLSFADWRDGSPPRSSMWNKFDVTLLTGGSRPRMVGVSADFHENSLMGKSWPELMVGESVALVVGGDPALVFAAHAPLPEIIHRSYFASWLRDKPLDMMRLPGLDIEIPSNAEAIIAATVRARDEDYVELNLISVWTKPNAIYLSLVPDELDNLRRAFAEIMLPVIRQFLPGVLNIQVCNELGVLTVNPSQANVRTIVRQLWAVPISANIHYWLLIPETDSINQAVERLAIDDIKVVSKLTQGGSQLGVLLDASTKREPWDSSEQDSELEEIFWHFKRHWLRD